MIQLLSPNCSSLMASSMVLLVFLFAMVGGSDAAWCVCRSDVSSSALQKALDYACGAGADCNPILQNGACYNPNTVQAHCSYAANSYFQRKGQTQQACDFAGTATLSQTDPSQSGCTYPATPSAAGTSGTPSTSTNTPGSSTGTGSLNPNSPTTTGTGVLGGGLGPSGTGLDSSDGGLLPSAKMESLFLTLLLSGLVLMKGLI